LGSYDNDWLFLDDDLFCVWFENDICENERNEEPEEPD